LPNVLIEAMSLGKAVVTTDCGGAADIVTSELDGFIVPVNDVEALASAVERLLRDPALRSRMEDAARISARRFEPSSVVAEWYRLFDEIARGQRGFASK
jgi:glycosyltransferase involved in cell wall biosynthesis